MAKYSVDQLRKNAQNTLDDDMLLLWAADEIERLHSEFKKILHHDSCQCVKCRNQI